MTTGTRNTGDVAGRMYDVADVISLLDVKRYPVLAILTNAGKDIVTGKGESLKKKETIDPEFKWFEDEFGAREGTTTDAAGNNDVDISAEATLTLESGDGDNFSEGDLVTFPSNQYVFEVTSVDSSTQIKIGAEIDGETGDIDLRELDLWIIGNVNEEGAELRTMKSTTTTEKVGYTQIFRTPFGVTNTAKNTKTFIKENDFDYQRRKKGIEHAVDIERAFLFGKAAKDTSGSHPKRFTQGIINTISTYQSANVDTEAEFEAALEDAFAHGNTEKTALASAAFISQINLWAKNKVQVTQSENTYGLQIIKYISPHGTLNLIKHDMLSGTKYGNYCVILDMETLTYRYLSGRDTKLLTDRQGPSEDSSKEEYLSEVGLQMEQESRHAILSKGAL